MRVWDCSTKNCLKLLKNTGAIRCIVQIDKNLIVLGCNKDEHVLEIWDIQQEKSVLTYSGHNEIINCLLFTKENQLVSASCDESIKIWNKSKCLKTLYGHLGSVHCLEILRANVIISGGDDKLIKIWNMINGVCLKTLAMHGGVYSILKLNETQVISCSMDKTVRVWCLDV